MRLLVLEILKEILVEIFVLFFVIKEKNNICIFKRLKFSRKTEKERDRQTTDIEKDRIPYFQSHKKGIENFQPIKQ